MTRVRISVTLVAILMVSMFIYLSKSNRKLHITGFALDGDNVIVTINGKNYPVENSRNAGRPKLNYLYEEVEYRSWKHNDLIHIKLDSGKLEFIDTVLILNNSNVRPGIFFDDPYLNNNIRKVSLENDSSHLIE
jgi:hypothetical protein